MTHRSASRGASSPARGSDRGVSAAAINWNLAVLREKLNLAATQASDAQIALAAGDPDLAIGIIFGFEQTLPECEALFRTILLLHRSTRT